MDRNTSVMKVIRLINPTGSFQSFAYRAFNTQITYVEEFTCIMLSNCTVSRACNDCVANISVTPPAFNVPTRELLASETKISLQFLAFGAPSPPPLRISNNLSVSWGG